MTRMVGTSIVVLMSVVAVAGCTVGAVERAGDTARTPPQASTPTTAESPSPVLTTPPTPTSAETPPVEPTPAEPDLGEKPPLRDDAVSGSGCSPGGDVLPTGWWYGSIDGPAGRALAFDLACYYTGAAAEAEAASRDDIWMDDAYVVNDNPRVRVVPVSDQATASCVSMEPRVKDVGCAPSQVAGGFGVWVRVEHGEVTRIFEQYAP